MVSLHPDGARDTSPEAGSGDVVPLDALTLDPHNRRKHGARNLSAIRDSLSRIGPARSIVVDQDLNVLAGNGTVQAAGETGITHVRIVPVDRDTLLAAMVPNLTEDDARYLGLADNRTAELAEWDVEQLLQDVEAGVDLTPFWSVPELDHLLARVTADLDPMAEWEGMPEYANEDVLPYKRLTVNFGTEADYQAFCALAGLSLPKTAKWTWWPPRAEERLVYTDE